MGWDEFTARTGKLLHRLLPTPLEKPPEAFSAYLREACGQVRWRRARGAVKRELLDHLEDQRDAFLEEGLGREEAERKAVEDLGPAALVGQGMDGACRPRRDWILLAAAGALVLFACLTQGALWAEAADPKWEMLEVSPYRDWLKNYPCWIAGGVLGFLAFYLTGPLCWARCGWVLPAAYWVGWALLDRTVSRWPGLDRWEDDGLFLACRNLLEMALPLAPVFGALLLYRLHGTGWPGALLFLGLCWWFWGQAGSGRQGQIVGCLMAGLLLWGLWSQWFGKGAARRGKLWAALLAGFLLLLSAGRIVQLIGGLIYGFGRQGYGAGYNYKWELIEPGSLITMDPNWVGPANGQYPVWTGQLLLDAVRRWGLVCILAVAVLLAVFFLRCFLDWKGQKKWLGKTITAAAALYLLVTGGAELGGLLGLWSGQFLELPFFCGGQGFVVSLALLGTLLAVRRDQALIPGRKAESLSRRKDST